MQVSKFITLMHNLPDIRMNRTEIVQLTKVSQ